MSVNDGGAASTDVCRELRLLLVDGVCVAVVGDIVCWDSVSVVYETSGELSGLLAVLVELVLGKLFVCTDDDVSEDGDGAENGTGGACDCGVNGSRFCC